MALLRVKPGVTVCVRLADGTDVLLTPDMPFEPDDWRVAALCQATGTKPADWFESDAAVKPRRVEQADSAGLRR